MLIEFARSLVLRVRVIGRLCNCPIGVKLRSCRRLITVHDCSCSGHKSCGEMPFGQLVATASTASDPKSAMPAVATMNDGHELDARVTFATDSLAHKLFRSLPLPLPLALTLSRSARPVVVAVVAALAVVTSANPICSLAAITYVSHPHPHPDSHRLGSLPASPSATLHSAYFDQGPRQPRTGVTCGIKYFEEGRSAHCALDLYTHTRNRTESAPGQASVGSMCHAPHSRSSPSTHRTGLVCTLALRETGWVWRHTHSPEVNSWSIYGQIFSPVIAIILSHICPYILVRSWDCARGLISFRNEVKIAGYSYGVW